MTATIREIKHTLDGGRITFDCELLGRGAGTAVVIYRMPAEHLLEDVRLPAGTVSVGYFWEDRLYNAYHWVDDAGRTLALYFNICDRTRIDDRHIEWRDLVVDVLLTPDRRCRVLDEDELPDELEPSLKARIDATRDRLCAQADALLAEFAAHSRDWLDGS